MLPDVSDLSPSSLPGREFPASPAATAPLWISVIVPVRNEARFIARTLECLLAQDYDAARFEILVIDGQSNDGTPEIVAKIGREHTNLRLFTNPRRLSSAARNVGIRQARGEVVLVVDGHCELKDRQYLHRLASAFERSGADCIGRPQPLDISGAGPLQRAIAAARSSRLGHHPDSFIYSSEERFVPAKSVAVAYRRKVFDQVGCFDETFDACEDVELNHRIDLAGLRCFFTPEVAVHYAPRRTLPALFRQLVRYGRGRVRLWRKYRDTMTVKTLLPAVFVLAWTLGLVPACLWPWPCAVYWAALAAYFAILIGVSAAVAVTRHDALLLPWLPAVFMTIHWGAGTGLLWEAIAAPGKKSPVQSGHNTGIEESLRRQ